MEGTRLILKRRIPRGRQRLVAVFAGALVIVLLIMVAQLKTTLSARSLEAVKLDLQNMRDITVLPQTPSPEVAGERVEEDPGEKAVEQFTKLLQDSGGVE